MLLEGRTAKDMDDLVGKLLRHRKARVVVAFFEFSNLSPLFKEALEKQNVEEEIVIVGSDTISINLPTVFNVQPLRQMNQSYFPVMEDCLKRRKPTLNPEDPWLKEIYAESYNCSWNDDENELEQPCSIFENAPFPDDNYQITNLHPKLTRLYDIVNILALAMDKVMRTECVGFEDKYAIRDCFRNDNNLINAIKETEFFGTVGKIKIDENGDAYARWVVYQASYYSNQETLIGEYNEDQIPKLSLSVKRIDWTPFKNLSQQVLYFEGQSLTIPESVCSKPCGLREFMIPQELECCWLCRYCHVNEIIINSTICKPCPFGQWPDSETATTCELINPTYLKPSDWVTLLLLSIGGLGFLSTLIITILYMINQDKKIIKATTKELCCIILFGIFVAFLSVFFFLIEPTIWSCFANRYGFNLSVCLIYSPLFVKTNRVFRIFRSTEKGMGRARLIGLNTQIIASTVLILIQVISKLLIFKPGAVF